jgi:hypothetical protein
MVRSCQITFRSERRLSILKVPPECPNNWRIPGPYFQGGTGLFSGLPPAESYLIHPYAMKVGFGELTACGEVVSPANVELIYSALQTSRQIFAYENFCK